MHPDVTCVIPNFNMADTLGTAIESAQRLGCRVFVSDDGSTDGSRDVIAACGVQAAYHESPSGGGARGLNEGLDACETEWVCWLDADDQLLAVEPLLVTGADWTVAPLAVVDDAGLRSTWDYAGWPTDLEGARAFARRRLSQPVSIRGAHRTAWLRENGLRHLTWPAGHHFGDDVLTCLEWLKARPRIVMIDTPCYLYRYRRRRWPHRDLFVRDLLAYLDEHERPA